MDLDQCFLSSLKEGCPGAYEKLINLFEAPLYRFFYCDHRDHHLAQEQTAETFAQLVHSLPKMQGGPESLPAFIFAVARRAKLRHWRRSRVVTSPVSAASEIADSQPTPSMLVETRERLDQVLTAIGALDGATRDAMLLRFVEGYSISNIADSLDMPTGTVKSLIHRGRARLLALFSHSEC